MQSNAQQTSSLETNAMNLRQWILDNRSDLRDLVECEIEFWHRFGETDVDHRSWGRRISHQKHVALIDVAPEGDPDPQWMALETRPDGTRGMTKISAPLG